MSNISINLIEEFKKRYLELSSKDTLSNGFIFNDEKHSWIFYDYTCCVELLNSRVLTKNRMQVPLELFDENQKNIVEEAQFLLTKSLIFRDHSKSKVINTIHENYKNINFNELTYFLQDDVITEKHLGALNNKLAELLTGISFSEDISYHAGNVGKLFDGKVEGRDHFVDIMKSFLVIYNEIRHDINANFSVEYYDIDAIDLSIAFVAAHQTTMQLIVAALFDIKKFDLLPFTCSINTVLTEVSRLHPPVLSVGRVFNEDYEYQGVSFKKGDKALFMTGLANFDPNVFESPFAFIPGRNKKPLSFGAGVHLCIGMGVAMSVSSKIVQLIVDRSKNFNLSISQLSEGFSALGAEAFIIEAGKNVTVEK
ncbi:cytochrome P450 [Pectobacterium betavasculorum]|uniref:cytochrome P450 n=1 Tax=Pectobacterium betavasculorum TaxID=55207 RepID=UPI00068EACBC|nr:cytochrome P450 [Pectobacterium betavasculorum]